MVSPTLPEVWLRGPVPGVHPVLMPVAHALLQVAEDLDGSGVLELSPAQLWTRPGGAASVGYHLQHLAGSTDRLLTYARGESLTDEQRAALAAEKSPPEPPPTAQQLVEQVHRVVQRAVTQLRETPAQEIHTACAVGRAALPSTVLGLLFHSAEHATRHMGQVITTVKVVQAG